MKSMKKKRKKINKKKTKRLNSKKSKKINKKKIKNKIKKKSILKIKYKKKIVRNLPKKNQIILFPRQLGLKRVLNQILVLNLKLIFWLLIDLLQNFFKK